MHAVVLAKLIGVLWEGPQNLLGSMLLLTERAIGSVVRIENEDGRLFVQSRMTAVSLGHFVFWSRRENRYFPLDENTRQHEFGHTFQSRLLGPLYLPLVGVPSSARVLYAVAYREMTGRRWRGYFDGYPENWADTLGGVARKRIPTSVRVIEET